MKFKVDENLPVELAQFLRGRGYDALTVVEQNLKGKPDSTVLEIASHEGRAFITLDQGFADIRRYPPAEYFGIIVLRLGRQDKHHVLSHFERVVPLFERQPLRSGCLWIVEESQVRIRS